MITFAAVACAIGLTATPAEARSPQTDQTVAVDRGARLEVDNFAGEVTIRSWDRDQVRVQARHPSRTRVSIRTTTSGRIAVSASGKEGPPGAVDYEISVPEWLPVAIDGTYAFIVVEGTRGEVSAETVRGDITIRGAAALVSASSVEGEVIVEGARGRVTASSVNAGVTVNGATGDVLAETTNGPITLSKLEGASVEAGSVNGPISLEGLPAAGGRVQVSTHNGDILVAIPESARASFTVRTYNGTLDTNLPLKGGGDVRRGRKATFTLGEGGPTLALESFGGTIRIRRPGTMPQSGAKSTEKD